MRSLARGTGGKESPIQLNMRGFLRHSNVRRHEYRRLGERPGDEMGTTGAEMEMWKARVVWGSYDGHEASALTGDGSAGVEFRRVSESFPA